MSTPRSNCKHENSAEHPADRDIKVCPDCFKISQDGGSTWAEGFAAPLEPTLEENHHWKWFREIGQKLCPQVEQQWHKDDPHICRPCEFAKKVAELYAAAVSKNLQQSVDQLCGDVKAIQQDYTNEKKRAENLQEELARAEDKLKTRDKCSYIGAMRDCPTHGESSELRRLEKETTLVKRVLLQHLNDEDFEYSLVGLYTKLTENDDAGKSPR